MKQIKKYLDGTKTEGLASKLASYSAMAAAAITFTPDASAQCVAAGGTLPVDIDGDGTPDITISNNTSTFFTLSASAIATAYYAAGPTVSGPGPYTLVIPGPAYTAGSCGPLVNAGDGAWTLNLYTYYVNFQYVYNVQGAFTYIYYNLNYVTAGANQIVGLSAGSSVCAGISAAGATAPATAPALAGYCYSGSAGTVVNVFTSYLYYFANVLAASDAEPVSNPAGCTLGGSSIATFTYYVPSFAIGPYSGFSQIAGPTSSVVAIGPGCAALPALGVEFTSADGTHYGWVQLSIGADGLLCVDATGYNGCTVEEVAAAGAAAGTECIAVGDATLNGANEACTAVMPVCTLASLGLAAGACTDPGTPDTGDDTFTLTIDPTGTDLGTTYTISGGATGTGTYGTPFTVTLPADGAAISITVTDDTDATCTLTEMVTAPASCSMAAPVCEISTSVDVACDDAGTPEDPSDDMTTVTVTVNNSDAANFPTFSDDQGNVGVAYGTAVVYTVVGDAGLTVNFTDDTDGACTDSISVSTGCETVQNIPTVGEWGLIMLGLLMSITAIVGIRQRREEEVTA